MSKFLTPLIGLKKKKKTLISYNMEVFDRKIAQSKLSYLENLLINSNCPLNPNIYSNKIFLKE